jgi:hypothetical protein
MSLFLAACGGDDVFTAGGCNPADTPTDVERFFVTSASTNTGGIQIINETDDFSLGWDLTSSCSYTYTIYLSEDSNFNEASDIEFASGTCGIGYTCLYSADIDCDYNATGQTMACNGDPAVDVSGVLPGTSPQSLTRYIFFTASNEMSDQSDPVFQQVQVEF